MTTFEFKGEEVFARYWTVEDGKIGETFSFDTETALIIKGEIPPYVIGQAYAGNGLVYFIKLKDLPSFLELNTSSTFIMHNAPFDISVVENETGFSFDSHIRQQRLFDTGLLYRLQQLAIYGALPPRWNLQYLTKEILGVEIEKDESTRCNFGQYRVGDAVSYETIPEKALSYAATDAIATFKNYEILEKKIAALGTGYLKLSHKIQLMGAYALNAIQRHGIGVDLEQVGKVLLSFEKGSSEAVSILRRYGYIPGEKGVENAYKNIIQRLGINLPLTPTGKVRSDAGTLERHRAEHEFIDAFVTFKEQEKLKSFLSKLKESRIYPSYNALVMTGRTSCSNPNLQQIPREGGIRECFVPSPNHYFIILDYSTLELCTLAQVCLDRYGESKMAELINQGVDLHTWFASLITNKSESEVSEEDRRCAKACNFGFPGGLGPEFFIHFAKKTYGIVLSLARAKELKQLWLESFPEMRRYLQDPLHEKHDFTSFGWEPEMAINTFKKIIGGAKVSNSNRPYSTDLMKWVFTTALPEVAPKYAGTTSGSKTLLAEVCKETVMTRTGRIRARVDYCQARNTPFQGLAADGTKIALYRLTRSGHKIVGFVHDEVIVEVPNIVDPEIAKREVDEIAVSSMKCVVPDVAIRVKSYIAERWVKK